MALTTTAIKNLKPRAKPVKVADGGGLHLLVSPAGGKHWRLKFRVNGVEKQLALGSFPAVGIAAARAARDEAKALLASGVDPSVVKRERAVAEQIAGATFSSVATEYIAKMEAEGRAAATLLKLRWYLSLVDRDLGQVAVAALTPQGVLATLRRIEGRGHLETATNAREFIGRICRFAIATGRAQTDPTGALRGALTAPVTRHRPALTTAPAFGGLLRAVWDYNGQPEVISCLRLMVYLAPRPGELRLAEWSEFDLDQGIWDLPAGRMKMRRQHKAPLPDQAVAILRDLREISRTSRLVFPGTRSADRAISENTMNAALRRLGYSKDEVSRTDSEHHSPPWPMKVGFGPQTRLSVTLHTKRRLPCAVLTRAVNTGKNE
jgi:integrase